MPLVQTPSQIVTDPRKYLTLLYGEPGSGKTSWLSQIPGHYILSCEPGVSGVSVFGQPVLNWADFVNVCKELKAAKANNFEGQRVIEVVGIDSYDILWDYGADIVMKNETFIIKGSPQRFTKVDDVEYGKAYSRVNQFVVPFLLQLKTLGFGVVIIAHQKDKTFKWRGQELQRQCLAKSQSVEDAIVKECDAIGLLTAEEEVRKNETGQVVSVDAGHWQYWQPTFTRLGKHRLQGFPERLPNPINGGWSTYEAAFKKTVEQYLVK